MICENRTAINLCSSVVINFVDAILLEPTSLRLAPSHFQQTP